MAEQRVQQAKKEGLALAIERRKAAGLNTEGMTDESLLENIEGENIIVLNSELKSLSDLEQPDRSPEDLMLSSVTGEGTQERAETEVLIGSYRASCNKNFRSLSLGSSSCGRLTATHSTCCVTTKWSSDCIRKSPKWPWNSAPSMIVKTNSDASLTV